MDWKQFAIDKLGEYNARKQSLTTIPVLIAEIDASMSGVRSARTDNIAVKTTAKNNQEDMLLNCIAKKTELQNNLSRAKKWIQCMDRALEQLQPEERRILELLFIYPAKNNVDRLCDELCVEKSRVYDKRNMALRRFTIILYGYVES